VTGRVGESRRGPRFGTRKVTAGDLSSFFFLICGRWTFFLFLRTILPSQEKKTHCFFLLKGSFYYDRQKPIKNLNSPLRNYYRDRFYNLVFSVFWRSNLFHSATLQPSKRHEGTLQQTYTETSTIQRQRVLLSEKQSRAPWASQTGFIREGEAKWDIFEHISLCV
jgi:hypothetical protein